MLNNYICVFDFETTSNRKSDTEIIQVAALAIDPRNLEPVPGGEFESMMRALEPDKIQDDALKVNGKTREQVAAAPDPGEVWANFARWCSRWNMGGKSDFWSTPVPAGHNVVNFDLPIYTRYCLKYGTVRTARNGEVEPTLFSNLRHYDTMQMLGGWVENLPEPGKLSLDYLRKFFAMPRGERSAHDALQDVRDTAAILAKLLRLQRRLAQNVIWKGAFDDEQVAAEQERREKAKAKRKAREAARRGREEAA